MFPVDVPETIKEPPLDTVNMLLVVISFASAPVVAPTIGSFAKSGIVTLELPWGTPSLQLLDVDQLLFELPFHVVAELVNEVVENGNTVSPSPFAIELSQLLLFPNNDK